LISFVIADLEEIDIRLDQFLTSKINQYSRSKIQSWIQLGYVTVNSKIQKKSYVLENNDHITIQIPTDDEIEKTHIIPEQIDLDILYEDEEIVIINKPSGMVVHPGKGNLTGTLIHGLLYHFKKLSNINGDIRPGIVHRLDCETSGVMVIAKTNSAHAILADQFKNRLVKKEYYGITWGLWNNKNGIIDNPIARDKKDPTCYSVSKNGKPSTTYFSFQKHFRHCSSVLFYPKTGRTHQIRVHAAYYGFPIFGDLKYGGGLSRAKGYLPEFSQFYKKEMNKIGRHMLHAKTLEFYHPKNKKNVIFKAPLPKEFINLLNSFDSFYE